LEEKGKGKALLSKRKGQIKEILARNGEERGRSTEVENDWDCPMF
jgi:hypothetical protein